MLKDEAMSMSVTQVPSASTKGRANGPQGGRVLLVEDEAEIAAEVRVELENAGLAVRVVHTLEDGLCAARSGWASVLVVDRMLNDADGLSIIEALRKDGDATPVLVISALSSVDERISGLTAQRGRYLVKPFDIRELEGHVQALLRRGAETRATRLKVGVLEMDLIDHTVRCAGRTIDLVPREFKLLEYFMRHPDQIVTRAMLLDRRLEFQVHGADQRRRRASRQSFDGSSIRTASGTIS